MYKSVHYIAWVYTRSYTYTDNMGCQSHGALCRHSPRRQAAAVSVRIAHQATVYAVQFVMFRHCFVRLRTTVCVQFVTWSRRRRRWRTRERMNHIVIESGCGTVQRKRVWRMRSTVCGKRRRWRHDGRVHTMSSWNETNEIDNYCCRSHHHSPHQIEQLHMTIKRKWIKSIGTYDQPIN